MDFLSIDVACYNEEESVTIFLDEIQKTLVGHDVAAARGVSKKGEPAVNTPRFHLFHKLFNAVSNLKLVNPVQGFATIMCTILLLGGIQLLSTGILGEYLENTYNETKNRPIFIFKEVNINDE